MLLQSDGRQKLRDVHGLRAAQDQGVLRHPAQLQVLHAPVQVGLLGYDASSTPNLVPDLPLKYNLDKLVGG